MANVPASLFTFTWGALKQYLQNLQYILANLDTTGLINWPSPTGNAGKILSTDGTSTGLSWISPAVVPTYVDNEVLGGAGVNWTLANIPNPASSVCLFVRIVGFGGVGLQEGTDFTIAGLNVTTATAYAAGALYAFYRY